MYGGEGNRSTAETRLADGAIRLIFIPVGNCRWGCLHGTGLKDEKSAQFVVQLGSSNAKRCNHGWGDLGTGLNVANNVVGAETRIEQ